MSRQREMQGAKMDLHCPYDEATLRQDADSPNRAICPCCWTSFTKPTTLTKDASHG